MKFTFLRHTETASYRLSTLIIAVILLILGIGGFKLADKFDESSDMPTTVKKVYVCDSSSLKGISYDDLCQPDNLFYKDVVFEDLDCTVEEAVEKAAADGDHTIVLEVKDDEEGEDLRARIIKPENFDDSGKQAKRFATFVENNISYVLSDAAGLTEDQKAEYFTGTKMETSVAGEDESSFADHMLKNIIPVLTGIVLYMMLCIYGQSVARCIVVEKDSKMMESLLVFTKPYDLIFGKILGMYFAAILQFFVWIAAAVASVVIGLSGSASAEKAIGEVLDKLSAQGGFTVPAAVTGIIAIAIGFLLYVALAAFTGSFASKSDEISNYFGIYTMAVVACWMFPYINQLNGNDHMLKILRYVPFTAPFTVPADIIVGNISMATALISIVLMIIATAAVVFLAAKVYKLLVLYRGEPVKIKDVLKMLRNSKKSKA